MSFATIDFTLQALDQLAQASGYPDAREALIDLTDPQVEAERHGALLVASFAEVSSEAETWEEIGMYVTDSNRKTPAPYATNAEANSHRRPHRHREAIAQMRTAGLSNDEQAVLLNRLDGGDQWTRARVAHVASQQGLTKVGKPLARGRNRAT